MNKYGIKGSYILISILLINSLISPMLMIGVVNQNSKLNIQDFNINYKSILEDDVKKSDLETIQVIVLFDKTISKSMRIELLDSVLEDIDIIDNYNIIPGVYLSCNKNELLEKEEQLSDISVINKIYKSNTYSLPYINGDLPKTSELNYNSFPNWWIPAIGADNISYNGTGVRVAVIDTGVYDHPDLNVVSSQNFVSGKPSHPAPDDVGHGTHVAGIIGGDGGGSGGKYRGVAPGVSLIAAKAGDNSGLGEGDVISAIDWSVNTAGADILSMSFGDNNPILDDPIILALENATDQGVISVSSAGNSGPDYLSGGSPASGLNVISVGATDLNNNLAFFSSRGPSFSYLNYPDVVAPGVNIISTEAPDSIISDEKRFIGDFFNFNGDADYIPLSGTSMACPIVSGALAILKQAFPSITPQTARIALLNGAQQLSDDVDKQQLYSGFGLINLSASLDYLTLLNNTLSNINDIAMITPDILPVEPFDLLDFPGDTQLFNLTLISGTNNTFNIDLPIEDGLTFSINNSQVTFDNHNSAIIPLQITINPNAVPGLRTFEINITSGLTLYDSVACSIEVRVPHHRILLDSFHGLNDWYPDLTFYQMNFYDWIKDLSRINISVDYLAEYWTPYYNKNFNNSILTEEKLAQYDLVVLQSPVIPYSPLEVSNLKKYFENGGNILFLGTRYEDMCVDNINDLFDSLKVGIQIEKENLADEVWLGIGASINTQTITEFNHSIIFNNVSNFKWKYGNTFSSANGIAFKNGQVLATSYDGRSSGKGRLVAFGDLYWLSSLYSDSIEHKKLSENLMTYYFKPEEVSSVIELNSESSADSQLNITLYTKDLNADLLIDSGLLNTYLNVSIYNVGFSESILMTSTSDGIAFNYSYTLPFSSPTPYTIKGNLTINSIIYEFETKFLYYDNSQIPKINNLVVSDTIERDGSLNIDANLDGTNYEVKTYLSIFPYTYYSKKDTINKTLILINSLPNLFEYSVSYTPLSSDPSGLVPIFILPYNPSSGYYSVNSPRLLSIINNNPPEFIENTSFVTIDNTNSITLADTHTENSLITITTTQGSSFDFRLNITDSVNYEDQNSSEMTVSVNFYMTSISQENTIVPIDPSSFPHTTLSYNSISNIHQGTFNIPFTLEYSSIMGTKKISTASTYNKITQDGSLGLIIITVFDSDGGSDDFLISLLVQQALQFDLILILTIVGIVVAIIVFSGIYYVKRKKRRSPVREGYYYEEPGSQSDSEAYYCPFCGNKLTGLRNFCPSCGKSLNFENADS